MNNSASILLVEDDIFTARMMELQFKKNGYRITLASNGVEALAKLAAGDFDLVLSDVMMPEMDGLEMLRRIRAEHSMEVLPVLMVTALDDTKRIMQALKLGANDFLTKTSEFSITLHRVELHLEMKRFRGNGDTIAANEVRRSQDGLWNWHVIAGEIYYSPRFKEILGFAADELGNSVDDWFSRIHPDEFEAVTDEIQAHQARRKPWFEMNFRIRRKDETYTWVHAFGVMLFGKDGHPLRMVGSLCDISWQHEISSTCKRQVDELDRFAAELASLADQLEPESREQKALTELVARVMAIREAMDVF